MQNCLLKDSESRLMETVDSYGEEIDRLEEQTKSLDAQLTEAQAAASRVQVETQQRHGSDSLLFSCFSTSVDSEELMALRGAVQELRQEVSGRTAELEKAQKDRAALHQRLQILEQVFMCRVQVAGEDSR